MNVAMGCFVLHIFIAGGSDKVEIKHQNVQTETMEIKDLHMWPKAISKEKSMFLHLCMPLLLS